MVRAVPPPFTFPYWVGMGKVINGLRNARLRLLDDGVVYAEDVKDILKSTEFGCTVHSTVFDASESKDLPWH